MALKIDILANTREAQRNVKDLGEALDQNADALDDVAREGDKAGDKLEQTFRDMVRTAEKSGRDMGDGMSDGIKKGTTGGFRDLKDEAGQSGREAAASFNGEWTDVGDFVQETVAQGLSGFGPVGAAAGLAAAAGLGVVTSEIIKQQEETERLGDYFATAYQRAAEEGRNYLDAATILGEANAILFDKDRANEYNQAVEDGKTLLIDTNTLVLARAGDQEALNTVLEATKQREDEIKTAAEEAGSTAIRLSQDEIRELDTIQRRYENIGNLHSENAQKAANAQEISAQLHQAEREQTKRTADAAQRRYEEVAARYGKPIRQVVQLDVDDSRVRNYRPPVLRGTVNYQPHVQRVV